MKIEKSWLVEFEIVKNGQVFEYLGNMYICAVILDVTGRMLCNAVNLENGKYRLISETEQVSLYENAKVVLI